MHHVSSPLKLRKTSCFPWETVKDEDNDVEELEPTATIGIIEEWVGKVRSAIYGLQVLD